MFCPKCGAQSDDSTNFCSKCGYNFSESLPQNQAQYPLPPQKSPNRKIVIAGLVFSILAIICFGAGAYNIFLYIAIILSVVGFVKEKKSKQKLTQSVISLCISLVAVILSTFIWSSLEKAPVDEAPPAVVQETTTEKRVLDENELSIYKNDIAWNMTMDEIEEIVLNSKYTYERGNDYIKSSNISIDFMAGSSISGNPSYIYSGVSKAYVFDDSGKLEKIEYIFPRKKGKDVDYLMVGEDLLSAYGIDSDQLSTDTNKEGHYVTDVSTESERLIVYNDGTYTIVDIIRK